MAEKRNFGPIMDEKNVTFNVTNLAAKSLDTGLDSECVKMFCG